MIFVATGTHHQPFERLVIAAERLAGALDEPVVLQRGSAQSAAPRCDDHVSVEPERFVALLRDARVVVLHGGSSSFLQARALGRVPIVVPRRPEHGEHVDDHQVRFARSVMSQARVVEPEGLLAAVREHHDTGIVADPQARSRRFAAGLQRITDGLIGVSEQR